MPMLSLSSLVLLWLLDTHADLCAAQVPAVGTRSRARVVYVAPNASAQSGDGSLAKPFTLDAARRSLSGAAAGVTVMLRGGDYHVSSPFVLTGADGGQPGAPVTYQSFPGERACITGGIEVPASLFSPVPPPVAARLRPAAAALQVADLRALGLQNASMLGGSTEVSREKAELFVRGHTGLRAALLSQDPTPLANGTWRWFGYDDIVTINSTSSTWFIYNNTELVERGGWPSIVSNSTHGLWLLSFWGQDGVQASKVLSLQPIRSSSSDVISAYNFTMDLGPSRFRSGTYRFKAVDALEFVDTAEEYWIDREQMLLYFLPKAAGYLPRLVLSVSPTLAVSGSNSLVELRSDSTSSIAPANIHFKNLSFYASTRGLFSAAGVDGVEISGCKFTGAGDTCVFFNGSNSVLRDNQIAECGRSGLALRGGNWNAFGPTLWRSANLSAVRHTPMQLLLFSMLVTPVDVDFFIVRSRGRIVAALWSRAATRLPTSGGGIVTLPAWTGREWGTYSDRILSVMGLGLQL